MPSESEIRLDRPAAAALEPETRHGSAAWSSRLSRRGVVAWLIGIAALSTVIRIVLVTLVHGPFIFPDELGYTSLAHSLSQTGQLALFGKGGLSYSPLYPALLAPIYALGASAVTAYHWIKVVNAVLMSLSVFPIYGIARFVLSRRQSVGVAALSMIAPLMFYTSVTMSENLAYPLFLVAVWAMLRAVRNPSARNDGLLLATILLACAARIQQVALFPAAVTAILLVALVGARRLGERPLASLVRVCREHWLLIGSAAALVAVILVRFAAGNHALPLAGRYSGVGAARTSPFRLLKLAVEHLGGLDFALGVLPFAGALVAAYALARYRFPRDGLVFASVAVGATFWLLLEVAFDAGAYDATSLSVASRFNAPRIHERYLIYLVPLFLVALFVALRAPRSIVPLRVYLVVAGVTALLPASIPFADDINNTVVADSFGLQLFARPIGLKAVPIKHATIAVVGLALLLTLVYLYAVLRDRKPAVIVVLVWVFVFMSSLVAARVIGAAHISTSTGLPGDRRWVDRVAAGSDVVLVGGVDAKGNAVRQTAFNNLSISRLYYTCQTALGPEFERPITVDRAGRLRDSTGYLHARYAVVPASFGVRGRVLARNRRGGLVLVAPLGDELKVPASKRSVVRCER